MRARSTWLGLALLCSLPTVARAGDGGAPPARAAQSSAQSSYDRGRAAYHVERWADAATAFREVLEQPHPQELGRYAAGLLFDCLNRLHRHEDLRAAVGRYCAWPELARDAELGQTCTRLGVQLDEQHAGELVARRQFAEAAAAWLALFDRYPGNPQRDAALYNAARSWDEAGDAARATAARKRLVKLYPKSPLARHAADELKARPRR